MKIRRGFLLPGLLLVGIGALTVGIACRGVALAGPAAVAEKDVPAIELGAPFADNAVLQRQMPVPVWGWTKPGAKVTVEFAGQKKTGAAGADGQWMVELDPLQASADPRQMVFADDQGGNVTLENILVGEVWLASGQSNMQWLAGKASTSQIIADLAAAGEQPPIRECKVTDYFAGLHPIEHAHGEWKDGDYANQSAIAFAFAHKLYEELGVPIGILNCSFSQTSIEAWTPRCGFAAGTDDHTRGIYRQILETDPSTPEHQVAWTKFYQEIEDTLQENARRAENGQPPLPIPDKTPGNLHGNRDATWLFNARLNPMIPYAIRGAIWNQGYANMGGGLTYYDNLHSMIRGWRQCLNRPDLPVYFHQFYCPGPKGGWSDAHPSIGSTAEMRLGTWLARDIPHANMASQIDVEGGIHYRHKAVPGQRLALHALKNQYGRKIVADGPMFKSYAVQGDKLIVQFDHADGGLVVAETGSNAIGKEEGATGFADPKVIADGAEQVKLFYLADENRVWHPASIEIDGARVIVTSPKVKQPRGVSYATGGVGFQPNLYNRALLPMTPFIFYDQKLVTSKSWPDDPIRIAGVQPDPAEGGKLYEYRKMPLLAAQFRDNAVLQAGTPITFWGSAVHDWGYEAEGAAVIQFRFAGIEETIPVTPGMREWQVTVPAMPASAAPKTLRVTFSIDGELVHERVCENIVIGDVWYVAGGGPRQDQAEAADGMVRVMTRKAKRTTFHRPSRYSVCVSTTPENRFASEWKNAEGGFAAALGERIHAKTGQPVGIIYMDGDDLELKHWIGFDHLKQAPSRLADYKDLGAVIPGNPYYDANARRYVAAWKAYWGEYIPQMIATKAAPDGAAWGSYPTLASSVTTTASQAYNIMVYPFSDCRFKGIIFLCGEKMFAEDQGANYGPELSALANCLKDDFGGADPCFVYTIPSKRLASKITKPTAIQGQIAAYEIDHWLTLNRGKVEDPDAANKQFTGLIERVVDEVYE